MKKAVHSRASAFQRRGSGAAVAMGQLLVGIAELHEPYSLVLEKN